METFYLPPWSVHYIYIYIFFFEKRPIKQNLQNTAKYVDEHENDKNMFIFKNIYINQQYIMT